MLSIDKTPKVSVIIPAYNAMDYLPESLNSVFIQTFEDYEVIVVDDGSQDDIKTWAATVQDPRFRLVSQKNRGLAGARNTGIREARGEYLALLDADDCWHKTKLQKQVQVLDSNPSVGLVYCWMKLVDPLGTSTGRLVKSFQSGMVWKELLIRNCVGSGSTPMIRKVCFDKVGDFDENLGSYMEDRDMWLRIAPHYAFEVVREVLVDYRQHPSSASKDWNAMSRSAKIILDKALDLAPADMSEQEKKRLIDKAWARIEISLAWKPLQSEKKDYAISEMFLKRALKHDPDLRLSKDRYRLQITTVAMRLLGEQFYGYCLESFYALRRMLPLSS